jgi:hypothetical protein
MTDPRAQIYAYVNPFPSRTRIEVLIDWSDETPWPDQRWIDEAVAFSLAVIQTDKDPPSLAECAAAASPGSATWDNVVSRFLVENDPLENPAAAELREEVRRTMKSVWQRHPVRPEAGNGAGRFMYFRRAVADSVYVEAPHFYFHAGGVEHPNPQATLDDLYQKAVNHAACLVSFNEKYRDALAKNEVTATQDDWAPVKALRALCRDEPTLGHLFRVLFYLEPKTATPQGWAALAAGQKPLWLVACPLIDQQRPSGFLPVATRLGELDGRPVTLLQAIRKGDPAVARYTMDEYVDLFRPAEVAVRQLTGDAATAPDEEVREGGPTPAERRPKDILSRIVKTRSLAAALDDSEKLKKLAKDLWKNRMTEAVRPSGVKVFAQPLDHQDHEDLQDLQETTWVESVVQAVHSLQALRPRYDAIGIRWGPLPDLTKDETYHRGFKGYRVDVQVNDEPQWRSLCLLDRRALSPRSLQLMRCVDGGEPREGYAPLPIQHDPTPGQDPNATEGLVVPTDFVHWSGASVVRSYPLDGLGVQSSQAAGPRALALRDLIPPSVPMLQYGSRYRFAVRRLGLSGMGPGLPPPPVVGQPFRGPKGPADLRFLRTIPMAAPRVDARLPSKEFRLCEQLDANDLDRPGVYVILDVDARVHLAIRAPLAHYKVALHARGNNDDETGAEVRKQFEETCLAFARRASDESPDTKNGAAPAPHLVALDPHLAAVEVAAEVWYPFSDHVREADRFVATGVKRWGLEGLSKLPFTALVVEGERLLVGLRESCYRKEMEVPVARAANLPELGENSEREDEPCIPLGVRSRVTCRGAWQKTAHEVLVWPAQGRAPGAVHGAHGIPDDGLERWSLGLVVVDPARRVPIGGRVGDDPSPEHSPIGGRVCDDPSPEHRIVRRVYTGLSQPGNEAILAVPPKLGDTGDTGNTGRASGARDLAHGSLLEWRRRAFSDETPTLKVTGDPRKAYIAFLESLLCGTFEPEDTVESPAVLTSDLSDQKSPFSLSDKTFTLTLDQTTVSFTLATGELNAQGLASAVNRAAQGRIKAEVSPLGEDKDKPSFKLSVSLRGTGIEIIRLQSAPASGPVTIWLDGPDRLGFRLKPLLAQGSGSRVAPAYSLPKLVTLIEDSRGTVAILGRFGGRDRNLPFVDSEIPHLVRLSWRVPLRGGALEHPRDLAAVKEFQLFRTGRGKAVCPEDLRAVLPRPGDAIFRDGQVHLDRVEWTWVDAVEGRDAQHLDYHIVAVPEYPGAFERQTWWTRSVTIPCSRIEPRPQVVVALPMLAPSRQDRRLALSFPADRDRVTAARVAVRAVDVVDDPLLGPDSARQGGARASFSQHEPPFTPKTYDTLFPTNVFTGEAEAGPPASPEGTGWVWADHTWTPAGASAPAVDIGCGSEAVTNGPAGACPKPQVPPSSLVFFCSAVELRVQQLLRPGNPFLKLQVRFYPQAGYPRLPQAVASDVVQTDWLQCYPEDLPMPVADQATLSVQTDIPASDWLRYRFHCFVADRRRGSLEGSVHLASFLLREPVLQLLAVAQEIQRVDFIPRTDIWFYAVVEQGFLFPTYQLIDPPGNPEFISKEDDELVFVTQRATPRPYELVLRPAGNGRWLWSVPETARG